jgi:hypothetical protein
MVLMIAKTTKPKCVLLDANVVIEAHRLNVWQKLTEDYELILPSIVIHQEALFFSRKPDGIHVDINLLGLVDRGVITQQTATYEELTSIYTVFDRVFIEQLDPGETEALALLKANRLPGAYFCTGDAPAIRALAMIGMSERGISMQTLLAKVGLQKNLARWFRENFFKRNIRIGQQNRITGEGLARSNLI